MPSRPDETPGPLNPQQLPADVPKFLSTGALQDPTLRTPGSEIPESIYAASDSSAFPLPPAAAPESVPLENPYFALVLALILVAIIVATTIYLYRDTHHAAPSTAPTPAHTRIPLPTPQIA